MIYILPIVTAASHSRIGEMDFGGLQQLGWLHKQYIPGQEVDHHDIQWTVVGPISFDDSNGNHWEQGDVITWSK